MTEGASYDEKCYELAEHFLPEGTVHEVIARVAGEIQVFAEDATREICEAAERNGGRG